LGTKHISAAGLMLSLPGFRALIKLTPLLYIWRIRYRSEPYE
jgi:hypothetical protein